MLIVCPACASAYEIDAATFGSEGRSVRCAACRETWFATPEADPPGEDPFAAVDEASAFDAAPDPEAATAAADEGGRQAATAPAVIDQPMPPRQPRAKGKPRKRRGAALPARPRMTPMLAAGLVVLAILPLAALGRGTVVRVLPQSAALFSALGLPVNLRGVEIRDVAAFRDPPEAGRPARLVVEGDLLGVARTRIPVPLLEAEIRDGQGRPLRRWTFAPPRAALEPAESARFRASLDAPPAEARGVEVRFTDAEAPAEPAAEPASGAPAEAAPPAATAGHGAPGHGGH